MPTTISSLEIRNHLGELLEQAHYQNKQFLIMRKEKPMAWLVGEVFMHQINTIVEHIIEHEPALADTLTLMLDPDIAQVMEQGSREVQDGQYLPLESLLEDK